MPLERLLAKSHSTSSPPDYALLTRHSRDVAAACQGLMVASGLSALRVLGIEAQHERLARALELNGWLQDLGKANDQFQEMLGGTRELRQMLRHEVISALLVWKCEPLRGWLAPFSDVLLMALWGAIGHHRKFDEGTMPEQTPALNVALHHPDFRQVLDDMAQSLRLGRAPCWERPLRIVRTAAEGGELAALPALREMREAFQDAEASFASAEERRLLALVKAYGIAADVAASALAKQPQLSTSDHVRDTVQRLLSISLSTEDLSQLIASWAWAQSSHPRSHAEPLTLPPDFHLRPFQEQVAASTSYVTLAEAGCGSGKSLAAYLWARSWCQRLRAEGHPGFRLFFCLPTTGTTTEHFKDYALESGVPAALAHSRASVDLQALAQTVMHEEADEQDSDTTTSLAIERKKLEALELWGTPLVVTTADTVLGALVHGYKSLCALPAILQSALVFDEVHAFPDELFGHLLVLLKHMPRLPVLLMTASLPESRRAALAAVRPDLVRIPGPEEMETLERYLPTSIGRSEEAWIEIDACLREGGRVLWVRNRVEWANESYRQARERFPAAAVNVYHSRLRYKDRSRRHHRVISDFKRSSSRGVLLVATQVAEMSLDLSADLLVTDLAPIPSLIQRMGRLNRKATRKEPGTPKPARISLEPLSSRGQALPYEEKHLREAASWLRELQGQGRPLSQRALADAFVRFSRPEAFDVSEAEARAGLFGVPEHTGLWRTRPGQTRGEGTTLSVLLEEDVKRCVQRDAQGQPTRDWVREHEVSIPLRPAALRWPSRARGVPVAPASEVAYDFDDSTQEGTGARWHQR